MYVSSLLLNLVILVEMRQGSVCFLLPLHIAFFLQVLHKINPALISIVT